jgi:chlorite dismutase
MTTTTKHNRQISGLFAHFLTALCNKGNTTVADAMNKDDSQISRFKNDEYKMTFSEFIELSNILGIEFNSSESTHITVDRLTYQSLVAISEYALGKTPEETNKQIAINKTLYNALLFLSQQRLSEMRITNNV